MNVMNGVISKDSKENVAFRKSVLWGNGSEVTKT